MNSITTAIYCPVVSTRDAEARGLSEVSSKTLDAILPVIELTRSRRSRSNPDGDIQRSIERLLETLNGRRFVLDVCGLASQRNSQTEELLDATDGFKNWTNFLESRIPSEAVPVVHLDDPFDAKNFLDQLKGIPARFATLALRVPTTYTHISQVVQTFQMARRECVVLLDGSYISEITKNDVVKAMQRQLPYAVQLEPQICAPLSSSFPSSVLDPGYGGDAVGYFPLSEVALYDAVRAGISDGELHFIYGDYSTIHPNDFTGTVTNWVPRVDIPLDRHLFYHRERRETGGYVECARRAVADSRFVPISSWGVQQVQNAAAGKPEGRSPSFWISVRLNIHIERQVNRLR